MGMSIDDSKRYLRLMLGGMKYAVRFWKDRDKEESDIEQTNVEAVKTALDTMRKYQLMQSNYEKLVKAGLAVILDKIRTEMFEEMLYNSGTGEEVIQAYLDGLKKGLDIIDKYKADINGDLIPITIRDADN